MKFLALSIFTFCISATVFAKNPSNDLKGEFQLGDLTFEWSATKDETKPVNARVVCPGKKQAVDLLLELNRSVSFDIKCNNDTFGKGLLMLVDNKFVKNNMGIFMDAYISDDNSGEYDMHFEGLFANWAIDPEPPGPPTPIDRDTWGVKFDSKKSEDFKKGFK